ncbi:hypothetical protein TanjilG_21285 [Lupinus angustifolius]|uniref:Uncharacterized protein n=1 Tax=Lupinus angustifolius TaxID=3871 RepID=A0A4P1RN50_LUPAN|nr:hypothetical protein TanjilG_21285 [Lupinus angustifolius]
MEDFSPSYSSPSYSPPSSPPPSPPHSTQSKPLHFSTTEAFSPSYSPPSYSPPSYSPPSYSPPSSPLPPSPPHSSQSKLLHPNAPPRNPYHDPSLPLPPQECYYKQVADKRRKIEIQRDRSILHGFDLQPTATSLLHSYGVVSLQNFINDFTKVPLKKRNAKKKLFNSLAFHYPTSFSLKLAKLLLIHPPIHIRSEVVSLLRETLTETHGKDDRKISCLILVEIKSPILESFKNEVEEVLLLPLSETIANVASRIYGFSIGGWLELLEYIVSCVSLNRNDDDSVLKQRKGLMLLAELSSDVIENREFWKNHYVGLYENLVVRMVDETANENFQNLTFNALLALMGMSQALEEFEVGGDILLLLLDYIDRNPREEIVLNRVQDLGDFISLDVDEVIDGKEENMFQSLLRIAEKEDASEELRCAAVQVIKELDEKNVYTMAKVMNEISDVDARRVLKVSLLMMLRIEEDPLWFKSNEESKAGISQSFALGRFLMYWLCFEADGSIIVPMAIEFLKTSYSASKNWRKRHAGMLLIAAFSERQKNDIVKCFVEFESLIMKSLNDGHHRVVWAAINATKWLGECKLIPHGKYQYHMKFFAKLFSIVKSIHCSKLQVNAIIAIRTLAINCGLDKMTSFGEEIVVVMLELLKNDQAKIKEEAVETLESVAALIPTNFKKYYHRTMETLKGILFHNHNKPSLLLRIKSLECMSSILSRTENAKAKFIQEDAVNELIYSFAVIAYMTIFWCSCLDENGRIHVLNILSHLSVRSMRVFYPHVGRGVKLLIIRAAETLKGRFSPFLDDILSNVALLWLYCLIEDGRSIMGEETEDGAKISDMAVSALGKICEFQCENIDDPQILFRSDELVTEETFSEILDFMDKHGGGF